MSASIVILSGSMPTLAPRQFPAPAHELPQQVRELLAIEKVKQIAEEARGADFDSAPPDEGWKQIAGFSGLPDPVAGMVGFHLADFVSNHRGYRTDGRD
jgi:hypothetical protein